MEGKRWNIAVDTGGTFTDCIAEFPGNQKLRIKVLSNGTLKGKILSVHTDGSLIIEKFWDSDADIFSDYSISIPGTEYTSIVTHSVLSQNVMHVTPPLKADSIGCIFELGANEEAPVLACRMATKTGLNENFPPIDLLLGSTKGTNALLEQKGAKCALIVTRGFKDLLLIGTQQRPELFELDVRRPEPIYHKVYEVGGRLDSLGNELYKLDSNEIDDLIKKIKEEEVDSVAVCLMHSYKNEEHEKQIGRILSNQGVKFISLSCEVSPAIKFLPRTETTLVNSYLLPIISKYLNGIHSQLGGASLQIMSSSGGLSSFRNFRPKDSLLSGPAGGVIGAGCVAKASGVEKILTLDMGGTSTDVSRYHNGVDYTFECHVGNAKIISPSVSIETVAAGGGSICSYDGLRVKVGPESAGAYPGPACYGNGGPLTVTDINLLLGRIDPGSFGIPVDVNLSRASFNALFEVTNQNEEATTDILEGFLQVANEKMAEAIRKISVAFGYDPKEYALLAFGGAGGQHACAVAAMLKMSSVIVPYDAGLLSAYGIANADIERFSQKQILGLWNHEKGSLQDIVNELTSSSFKSLVSDGYAKSDIQRSYVGLFLRFVGQENSIEIKHEESVDPIVEFKNQYEKLYGHWVDNKEIELESVKVVASVLKDKKFAQPVKLERQEVEASEYLDSHFEGKPYRTAVYRWEQLQNGVVINGPAIVTSKNSTLVIDTGWEGQLDSNNTFQIVPIESAYSDSRQEPESIRLELFTNRFMAIADEMGELLKRTAFSVNIKERLDFSCGVLDASAELIVNAPHIPVHLGSLGVCVRKVIEHTSALEGDILITNHPKYGGSHLPDITLIAPVHYKGELVAYVANRAHHAEVGGKRPGSMPPDAENLAEEGVVFLPQHIVSQGTPLWSEIEQLLTDGAYPSRSPKENLADLRAAIASLQSGKDAIVSLCDLHGPEVVIIYMQKLKDYVQSKAKQAVLSIDSNEVKSREELDDGHVICVEGAIQGGKIKLDFQGTSGVHPGNLNANSSIVTSAVLYVLRLMISENIPLNEGIMKVVDIEVPESMLNPNFKDDPFECPAVVGGNTEVSQRLVDTLIKAFNLSACSQGTMNNLLFGNQRFGYYETICGGTGAGDGFHGASGVHHHMTNTMITDPEILEHRYPVILEEFSLRKKSGGQGKWVGGDGIVRKLRFTENLELTLLTQHRRVAPFGMNGGEPGKTGRQYILTKENLKKELSGIDACYIESGDLLVIETPGGGGFGSC